MNRFTKWKIVRIIITAVYLFTGWLLFSESLSLISVSAGIFFSFAVALFSYSLFIDEQEAEKKGTPV